MHSVQLLDGKIAYIGSNQDVINTVAESMGYDFAKVLEDKLKDTDYTQALVKAKAKTDEEAYLSSLESAECALRDVLEIAETLGSYLSETNRISRDKIFQQVLEIEKIIGNEL